MSLKFIVKIPTTEAENNKNDSCNPMQNIDGIINPDVGLDVPVSKMASLKNLWFRGGYFFTLYDGFARVLSSRTIRDATHQKKQRSGFCDWPVFW
ncbi:hypothetical protein [Endozoicomonas sp. ISHI1]|uniref:hypothetical protein n=1 Tax=Endozoicomonas sp. ISHI1 TaxID=2825882 RepID=UPI00214956A9|nr:hypothetical protein [Endozoicomonas sp. ISHI1]